MSIFLGLTLGFGLLLVYRSFTAVAGAGNRAANGRIEILLLRAGLDKVTRGGFISASITAGVIVGLIVLILTGAPLIALTFAGFGTGAPWVLVAHQATKRAANLREQWPDVVDHLRSAIRAGMSLPEALTQLGQQGPEALRPAFTDFGLDYRATARFNDSLERLAARLADPVADKIVEALRITREVGGTDLGEMLGTLSSFLRDSARTRGELEARQSWTVSAARLAIAAPWVILLLLASQPAAVYAYSTVTGMLVLVGGLVVSFICYRAMMRIGRLPEEERVFR
ncbi:type II secretion system F family protein [Paeniglutamicibacter sp. ABSL32-1]|uniref:type II secretion system F family protein n=1 Tax=Paeniglutamicibacter quisquiliarum TaxID=2849498 RepID=UPI001C2DEA47|nr:type II secretion system F family protein [Paeniglutamicibacter quisquiliarum]MBV1780440.1 type II secretion system F family protein [Paeniglutamicibacter quisquiliarum]